MTEHRPITDAKAERLAAACERVRVQSDSQDNLVAKVWTEHCSRLLADRAVAMGMIEEITTRCWVETGRATTYCFFCGVEFDLKDGCPPEYIWMGITLQHNDNCLYVKARTLLAATKGE